MNPECSEHQKKIAALFLGDLDESEKQELEAHLAMCSRCCSEKESYARTIQQLTSAGELEVPRHFFVYPEERASRPWHLFRQMSPAWQAAMTCAAILILCLGIAAVSRLQIRSDSTGWMITFGGNYMEPQVLKKEILDATRKDNERARVAWRNEVQKEFSLAFDAFTERQKTQLMSALAHTDSQLNQRIKSSEGQTKTDTRILVSELYRLIAQQRARDLEAINLRFESTDANNAIKARQTNEILDTLLQVADLKLK